MSSKKILFVCIENAGRSQIAEAFFRKHSTNNFCPISAGTKPTSQLNPIVVKAMKEIGINLEQQIPKTLTNEMIKNAPIKVNMGCMDKQVCPALFVKDVIEWNIPDPKTKSLEEVRKIRDEIEFKVKELISTLKEDS